MTFAVIDTNVIVSALLTKNPLAATRRVLDLLLMGKVTPLFDDAIIAEYRDVLKREKFGFAPDKVDIVIDYLQEIGLDMARTIFDGPMLDEDDRVFYEVSLTMDESFLVTGNIRHFPSTPKVVTPAEFLERIKE